MASHHWVTRKNNAPSASIPSKQAKA